jgi:hypothetical protein
MSNLSTEERGRLDAILEAAGDFLRASGRYRERSENLSDDEEWSSDYYLEPYADEVVAARDRFGKAMDAWLEAKLAARPRDE